MFSFFNKIHRRTQQNIVEAFNTSSNENLATWGSIAATTQMAANILVKGLELHKDSNDEISGLRSAALFAVVIYVGVVGGFELAKAARAEVRANLRR